MSLRKSMWMTIKTSKFGWCATSHHEECRVSFVDWSKNDNVCSCECHIDKDEVDGRIEV